MKKLNLFFALVVLMLGMNATTLEADFIQCVFGGGNCDGTPLADIINGTEGEDTMDGEGGDDVMFGGDGPDGISGADGNDIAFGGRGEDSIVLDNGNDIIFPGPDDVTGTQFSSGSAGNDAFIVFAGETVNCQIIRGGNDFDVVNLIGFGPYVVAAPFSPDEIADGSVMIVQDPIAGGFIFIFVSSVTTDTVELINGMPTPNVTIVDGATWDQFQLDNCSNII